MRLEDTALRIDERNPLTLEEEAGLQLGGGQVIVHFPQHSDMRKSGQAHDGVPGMISRLRHGSSLEAMLVVPAEGGGIGPLAHALRHEDPLAVQGIVVFAVVEFFTNAAADFEVKLGRNGHIACVKEAVDVASEKQAVSRLMLVN